MATTEEARGTADRQTADRRTSDRGRGRVELVSLERHGLPVRALMRVVPGEPVEPVVLDEMRITPAPRSRNQDAVGQARQLLTQAKSGQRVADRDVERLQQRLLSMEHQAKLAGRESEARPLVDALAEVRRSQLIDTALNLLARAKRQRHLDEREVVNVQQRLVSMEQQDQIRGNESQGMQLAVALGEVRRSQLIADANAMLARMKQGRHVPDVQFLALQRRLVAMEKQDEVLGRQSEGLRLAVALAEARR